MDRYIFLDELIDRWTGGLIDTLHHWEDGIGCVCYFIIMMIWPGGVEWLLAIKLIA
jgi:hypothetical protein